MCAVVVCHGWAKATAQTPTLTRAAIADAIALGEAREPEPYLLGHAGDARTPIVVGAVYTPFLRVALLSRAAALRGERLDPESLDPALTEPLVYVAFRWYCCDTAVGTPDASHAFDAVRAQAVMLPLSNAVTTRSRGTVGPQPFAGTPPVWSKPGIAVLEQFGAAPTHDDVTLVAAFPLESLTAGRRFAVYKDTGTLANIRVGAVRAADVARWR
jgi:hypothetical protein